MSVVASGAWGAERFGVDVPPKPAKGDTTAGNLFVGYTKTNGTRTTPPTPAFRSIPQKAFGIGERLVLSVRFMGIPCGELVMTVPETTVYRGRAVYKVQAHAYTNRAFSVIYAVSDTLTSYIDVEGMFPWRHEKEIHETKEDTIAVCEYDPVLGVWTKNGVQMGELEPYTQDLLSSFYYLRALDWAHLGETISMPLNDMKKNYDMLMTLGERRRMYSHALDAWVSAQAGIPVLQLDDKYKQIGTNEVWFTDDRRRIPILIRSHILLGTFYAKLVEYKPGRAP
ncbi:DUF3108 domain-containing protein [bacterium]|nr:DUF3108 domain-containing protein [bacterium]